MKIDNNQYHYNYLPNLSGVDKQIPNSSILSTDYQSYLSSLLFINDFSDSSCTEINKSVNYIGVIGKNEAINAPDFHTNFPHCFRQENKIKVPSKVEYALRRFVPKGYLNAIDSDFDVSVEKCLLYTSNFSSTYFDLLEDEDSNEWKELKAEYLQDYFSNTSQDYKNIFKALNYAIGTGPIVERNSHYTPGKQCYNYRLGDAYVKKGLKTYELKTEKATKLLNKRNAGLFEKALQNVICKNLLMFYSNCTFPTIDEIIEEAKRLIANGYRSKKGKKLIFLNKRSREYYLKKEKKLSFVEDDIKRYQSLTENGLRIPAVGSESFGRRVIDSITLMPGWIRSMIKIDGELLKECDYICLHPNIAVTIYEGTQEYITHEKLAAELGIDKLGVKKQHLAYFNEEAYKMHHFKVDVFYQEFGPEMMQRIIAEKKQSRFGNAVTSRNLFCKEVEIMTDVIIQLNKEGIYVGYVYDALLCHPKHGIRVKQVMDDTVLKHGVKTMAKLSR